MCDDSVRLIKCKRRYSRPETVEIDRRETTAVQKAMHRTRTLCRLSCVLDDQSKTKSQFIDSNSRSIFKVFSLEDADV